MSAARYLISCGGTGGHLAPGIALAQALMERGHRVTLLISEKKVDAQLAAKYPEIHFRTIPGAPLSAVPRALVRFIVQQTRGLWASFRLIGELRPVAIVGFGGFTTAAVIVVGALRRVPVALHEANRVPGRAIRMMAFLARRIYLPIGVKLGRAGDLRVRHASVPVRAEIRRELRDTACGRFGLDPTRPVVAVLGGSQGATALNDWAHRSAGELAAAGIQLCCVTGSGKGAAHVETNPGPQGEEVVSVYLPFCDRMADLLSAADVAVSRAGAGTIAELIRCETPSILVPYPFAADNHQAANAEYLQRQGAAVVVEQKTIDAATPQLLQLVRNEERLAEFRRNLRLLDREDTLRLMVDDLERFYRQRSDGAPLNRPRAAAA